MWLSKYMKWEKKYSQSWSQLVKWEKNQSATILIIKLLVKLPFKQKKKTVPASQM